MKIRRFISKMDVPLLIITGILFIFGLLNIVNASSQAVALRYGTSIYYYFYRQLAIILVGTVLALFILKIPTKNYYKLTPIIYFSILGLLIYLFLFGEAYLGSVNWINIAGFKFQPSEFSKPVMIIAVSLLFELFSSKLKNNKKYTRSDHFKLIWIIIFVGILFSGFVFLEKDLGTTLILVGIFAVMFISSPIQISEKLQTIVMVIIILAFGALIYSIKSDGKILNEEQMSRLDFYDPCSSYEDGGYQICNGFIAINSGGLLGVGIGNSKQVSYLPESHTDSVFAIISEEYGLIIGTIIFLMYLVIIYRIFNFSDVASGHNPKNFQKNVPNRVQMYSF